MKYAVYLRNLIERYRGGISTRVSARKKRAVGAFLDLLRFLQIISSGKTTSRTIAEEGRAILYGRLFAVYSVTNIQ